MSAVRLQGGAEILSGWVDWPLVGLWTAEVEADTEDPPANGDMVTIEIVAASGDTIGFSGAVRTSGESHGRARLFVVAGAGGLGSALPAQHYSASPTALQLVVDLLDAAGETLSPTVDTAALGALAVASWMRAGIEGGASLTLIAEAFGLDWRALADGSIWVGARTWAEYGKGDKLEITEDTARPSLELSDAETIAPGHTLQGRPVTRVEVQIDPATVRTVVTFDRVEREDWRGAVRGALPEQVYRSTYSATVVAQNANGTLELVVDDARLGGLSQVPYRLGVPGATVSVSKGARVRVAFDAASPALAYACDWDADVPLGALRFTASPSYAGKAVARVDDHVACGQLGFVLAAAPAPPYAAGSYILTIRYSDADALVDIMTILLPPGTQPILPVDGTKTFALLGKVSEGNTEVLA